MKQIAEKKGFTIIELLLVVVLVATVFSVALPISYRMYSMYKASSNAHEVMIYVSGIRREAFICSERKVVASQESDLMVGREKKEFTGVRVHISPPIVFYPNGTSSGGIISLQIGEEIYRLEVKAPMGNLSLTRA